MITIKNIKNMHDEITDLMIEGEDKSFDGSGLIAIPAVIDPHVHFRTPGFEYKENWCTGAKAALRGGCTTVFDMPNTNPPTITALTLQQKKALIAQQLKEADIALHYDLFFGADKDHLHEIAAVKDEVIGIKVFMGCSTGNLVIDNDESLHAVFSLAALHDMLVAVHAEDEHLIKQRKANDRGQKDYAAHSRLRDIEVAATAVEKAISLAKKYGTRLYILHVSSQEEVDLIRSAKKAGLHVFAETTPHHLFFNDSAYAELKGKAVVNPPLREAKHQPILFSAIHEKMIDTIGSDHAPHTLLEKERPYGECPSGMPGIEFMLPLLFNAYHAGKLTLQEIVSLTHTRAREIFRLAENNDWVIIDPNKILTVTHTESRCGWTPYQGMTLQGWPVFTILNGRCYAVNGERRPLLLS